MRTVTYAIIPLAVLLFVFVLISTFNLAAVIFNPNPYLLLFLNVIFITAANIIVAAISAKSYLNQKSLNILFLGSGLFISGLVSIIEGWGIIYSPNFAVTVYSIGILVFAGLQFFGALTPSSTSKEFVNGKVTLILAFSMASIFLF